MPAKTEETEAEVDQQKRAALKKYTRAFLGAGAIIITADEANAAGNAYKGQNGCNHGNAYGNKHCP